MKACKWVLFLDLKTFIIYIYIYSEYICIHCHSLLFFSPRSWSQIKHLLLVATISHLLFTNNLSLKVEFCNWFCLSVKTFCRGHGGNWWPFHVGFFKHGLSHGHGPGLSRGPGLYLERGSNEATSFAHRLAPCQHTKLTGHALRAREDNCDLCCAIAWYMLWLWGCNVQMRECVRLTTTALSFALHQHF